MPANNPDAGAERERATPALSAQEKRAVKQEARYLLAALKAQRPMLDWRKRQRSRAAVQVTIEEHVWELPESCYTDAVCEAKVGDVYHHAYEHDWGRGRVRISGRREGNLQSDSSLAMTYCRPDNRTAKVAH